jgi:hypothetical protein
MVPGTAKLMSLLDKTIENKNQIIP